MVKFVIILIFFAFKINAQTIIPTSFTNNLFNTEAESKSTRKIAKIKNKYNPISYIGAGALFVYQNIISEQIQASCTYHYSCSEFTKKSIENFGFIKGTFVGLNQLQSCVPGLKKETHPYFITSNFLIENRHYFAD